MFTITSRVAYYREVLNIGNVDFSENLIPILIVGAIGIAIFSLAITGRDYFLSRRQIED